MTAVEWLCVARPTGNRFPLRCVGGPTDVFTTHIGLASTGGRVP